MTDILTVEGPPRPTVETDTTGQIVWSWTGSHIRDLIRSNELRAAYNRWLSLVDKGLPRLNEILDTSHLVNLNDAMLLLRLPDDFAFLQQGAASVKIIGTNLTGQLLSERTTPIARALTGTYRKCAESAVPFYIRHVASATNSQNFFIEQVMLPVAADETRQITYLLVYSAPLDDKSEVLQAFFDRSQIGMVAASSNHDNKGKLQDGRILLMNEMARVILRLPDAGLLHTVRDLGLWFRDGALWTKTGMKSENSLTHIFYSETLSAKHYRVTIEPLERFVLFSFIEAAAPN